MGWCWLGVHLGWCCWVWWCWRCWRWRWRCWCWCWWCTKARLRTSACNVDLHRKSQLEVFINVVERECDVSTRRRNGDSVAPNSIDRWTVTSSTLRVRIPVKCWRVVHCRAGNVERKVGASRAVVPRYVRVGKSHACNCTARLHIDLKHSLFEKDREEKEEEEC